MLIALLTLSSLFPAARQGHCPDHRKKEGNSTTVPDEFSSQCVANYLRMFFRHRGLKICLLFVIQRGKTVPEELVRAEDLSKYRQVASHAVSLALECASQASVAGAVNWWTTMWGGDSLYCKILRQLSEKGKGFLRYS